MADEVSNSKMADDNVFISEMYDSKMKYALVVCGTLNSLVVSLVVIATIIRIVKERVEIKKRSGTKVVPGFKNTRTTEKHWKLSKAYLETGTHALLTCFAVFALVVTDVIHHPFEHNQSGSSMIYIVISASLGTHCGRMLYSMTSTKKFLRGIIENLTWVTCYSIIVSFQEFQLVGLIGIIMESNGLVRAMAKWMPCIKRHKELTLKESDNGCCAVHKLLRLVNTILFIPCRFIVPFVLLTLGIINERPQDITVHNCSIISFFYFICFISIINIYRAVCEFSWMCTKSTTSACTFLSCCTPTRSVPPAQQEEKNNYVHVPVLSLGQSGSNITIVKNIYSKQTNTDISHMLPVYHTYIPSRENSNVDIASVPKSTNKQLLSSYSQMNGANKNNIESPIASNNGNSSQVNIIKNLPRNSHKKAPNFAVTLDTISEYSHPSMEVVEGVTAEESHSPTQHTSRNSANGAECWFNVEL